MLSMKSNYELELKKISTENCKNKDLVLSIGEKNFTEVESTKEKLFLDCIINYFIF